MISFQRGLRRRTLILKAKISDSYHLVVERRGCPGSSFALVVVEYMIANVVYWLDCKVPDGGVGNALMDHKELDMSEDTTRNGFGELPRSVTVQLTAFSFGNYFAYLRWMDVVTGLVSSLKATFRDMDPILEKVIEDHKEALSDKDEQSSDHKKEIGHILRQLEKDGLVRKLRDASSRGLAVNLSQMLIATSNNVISRCILGQKYEEDETTTRFGELSKRAMSQFTAFNFRDFFPYLSWMDVVTGLVSSLHATFRELDPFLEKVIEDHKAALSDKDEQSSDNKKDIVDILLQLQKDGGLDMELTNVNLKAILLSKGIQIFGIEQKSLSLRDLRIAKLISEAKIFNWYHSVLEEEDALLPDENNETPKNLDMDETVGLTKHRKNPLVDRNLLFLFLFPSLFFIDMTSYHLRTVGEINGRAHCPQALLLVPVSYS
ncbi:hypothetical protein FEM48_Zijuj05G0065100 [Ziziphus jujuba var. spinosa]|uniref:Uncharacterized protein n=1 Tax=Ziziphus jujuba var. spinosa TaxID=714518 RepID=A0A978VDC9_ZIZJJ|nr:hypothetical protein FEM48_Zijuj05G0065100 [Ziziphus jujuba var. spinosa]